MADSEDGHPETGVIMVVDDHGDGVDDRQRAMRYRVVRKISSLTLFLSIVPLSIYKKKINVLACLPVCLSIYLSICLSVHLSIYLSI